MVKYTDYRVVREESVGLLEIRMREYFSMGWIPLGGVTFAEVYGQRLFMQAVGLPVVGDATS